jgi:NAD-dependent deacetylase
LNISPDLIHTLRSSSNVVALTGAGVSQESGLRTFRDPQEGLWAKYQPETLATLEAFERNPDLVWEFYSVRRLKNGEVQPNPGHIALSIMERKVPHFTLITQNVDGLHQRAGSKYVVELHGNISRIKCSRGCGLVEKWEEVQGKIPACPICGANLRPDVVWFGENLPGKELDTAFRAAQASEFFFSIGTSGMVQPAASLPLMAKQSGAIIVEINLEETPLTPSVDYFLKGKSGEVLPDLVFTVWDE